MVDLSIVMLNYQRVIHHFIKIDREAHLRGAPLRGVWQPRMGESRPCPFARFDAMLKHVEPMASWQIYGKIWEIYGKIWEIYMGNL
jgi:hypothetical protein